MSLMPRHSKRKSEHGNVAAVPSKPVTTVAARTTLKHRWLARLLAAVLVPVFVLGAVEAVLRVIGFGFPTNFFIEMPDGKTMTTNPKFAWQYYPKRTATAPVPLLFSREKAPGVKRVFVLGESAAAGTPDPAYGFCRILEVLLRNAFPSNHVEVLNAAMRGIDSHIVRDIAAECAQFDPDLFIVYCGNNDMIGLHSPSPGEFQLSTSVRWYRFKHGVQRLRLAQAGNALLGRIGSKPAPVQDQPFFRKQRLAFDDPQREPVYRNFGVNLRAISESARDAGTEVLLCTVGVNLRDFPPLASLHRAGLTPEQLAAWEKHYAEGAALEAAGRHAEALARFEQALSIDDHYAELLFRVARCHEALGKRDDAQRFFAAARDWDALQFRTDIRMNDVTRSVATNTAGVRLVDVESALGSSRLAENGLPGRRLFQEHVHLTFDGDYEVAQALFEPVTQALQLKPTDERRLSRDECARALAYTAIDDLNVRAAVNRLTGNPPFLDQLEHRVRQVRAEAEVNQQLASLTEQDAERALAVYRAAMDARPADWMLRFNCGNLLSQLNRPGAAVPYYAEVVQRLPAQPKFRVALGDALRRAGKTEEARREFEEVLKLDSDYVPAREALGLGKSK
jgi:tetratricopeptide (TPR) repeat protein